MLTQRKLNVWKRPLRVSSSIFLHFPSRRNGEHVFYITFTLKQETSCWLDIRFKKQTSSIGVGGAAVGLKPRYVVHIT